MLSYPGRTNVRGKQKAVRFLDFRNHQNSTWGFLMPKVVLW